MFMDKETAEAWGEQQAREIKNLKAVKKAEKERIINIINELPSFDWGESIVIDKPRLLREINGETSHRFHECDVIAENDMKKRKKRILDKSRDV